MSKFALQRRDLLAQVKKARQKQTDAADDVAEDTWDEEERRAKERLAKEKERLAKEKERRLDRFSEASERLLAIGNLWLVCVRFKPFVRLLISAGLLAVLMTVASVVIISSAGPDADESRAQERVVISLPTAVLFIASSEDQHRRLFGRDCPPDGVRGVAVPGSPNAPEVVTYGTELCRARRIRVDKEVGVVVPLGTATPPLGSANAESSRLGGGSGVSNSLDGSGE